MLLVCFGSTRPRAHVKLNFIKLLWMFLPKTWFSSKSNKEQLTGHKI